MPVLKVCNKLNNSHKDNKMVKKTSSTDILGLVKSKPLPLPDNCFVCGKPISNQRKEALIQLNISTNRWTHTQCSQDEKIKGVYLGEVGTSQLQLVTKVYNDSVRDVFVDNVLQDED